LVAFVFFAEHVHQLSETLQGLTLAHQNLTAQQVQRLDTSGAFIQQSNTSITNDLLHAPLGDKAVTAVDLHTQVGRFIAHLSEERLSNRRQEAQHFVGIFTHIFVSCHFYQVALLCSKVDQRPTTFSEGFLGQQHTTYVRVYDNGVSRTFWIFHARQCTHGQTLFSIFQRALERGFCRAQTLDRSTQTSNVHKGEHAGQTFVFRSYQPAFGTIEVHHTGRVTVDTHLVLDGAAGHVVTLTHFAFRVRQELGNDEQGDTLGALRRIGQTGQNDVDDVLGHVVLASRNKNLGTGDVVAAVCIRLSLGTQNTQVRTTVRLSQTHGASPDTGNQLGQINALLLFGAVGFHSGNSAVAQARIHTPRPVGATDHFAHDQAHGFRQTLTAELNRRAQRRPATLYILLIGFLEASRSFHSLFRPGAAFTVTDRIQRRKHLLTEFRPFTDNGTNHIGSCFFCSGQIAVVLFSVEHFIHDERHVT